MPKEKPISTVKKVTAVLVLVLTVAGTITMLWNLDDRYAKAEDTDAEFSNIWDSIEDLDSRGEAIREIEFELERINDKLDELTR